MPCKVKVEKLNPKVDLVYYGQITLTGRGDEATAVRFTVGVDGRVTDVNRLQKLIVPQRRRPDGSDRREGASL